MPQTYEALKQTVENLLGEDASSEYHIQYVDRDEELINVSDDEDLQMAYQMASSELNGSLKFVINKPGAPVKEKKAKKTSKKAGEKKSKKCKKASEEDATPAGPWMRRGMPPPPFMGGPGPHMFGGPHPHPPTLGMPRHPHMFGMPPPPFGHHRPFWMNQDMKDVNSDENEEKPKEKEHEEKDHEGASSSSEEEEKPKMRYGRFGAMRGGRMPPRRAMKRLIHRELDIQAPLVF